MGLVSLFSFCLPIVFFFFLSHSCFLLPLTLFDLRRALSGKESPGLLIYYMWGKNSPLYSIADDFSSF